MPKRTLTTQEIADLLDVDPSTIQNWVKLGCPCDKGSPGKKTPHKFDPAEVANWQKETKRTGKPGRPVTEDGDELKALKIRKEAALVTKYERENAVEEGRLIDSAEEQRRDVGKITTLRNRLCGLGAILSPQLEGLDAAERQTLIDQQIEILLTEFAQ